MRRSHRCPCVHAAERVALAVVLAAVTLALASPAPAQCPESLLNFPSPGPFTTTAPTFDMTSPDLSWILGDHRAARYSLHHSGFLSPTVLVARDRFDVTGVPLGTAVSAQVSFVVDGWAFTDHCGGSGCCGTLTAIIRSGADSSEVGLVGVTFGGRSDFSGVVQIPVTLVAGTSLDIEVEMRARRCAGGSHTVDATGSLVFNGTTANAVVTSCKGFGPRSVPVRHSTWGGLKAIYR